MNRKKFQIDVCKALLEPNNRVYCGMISDKEISVTINGFEAMVFDKEKIIFDIEKIKTSTVIADVFKENENDVKIQKTKELFESGGNIIEKYESESFDIYINKNLAQKWSGAGIEFYAFNPFSRILVKDSFGRALGVFLPLRFDESEIKRKAAHHE